MITPNCSSSLAGFLLEGVWQVWLLEFNVNHILSLRIVTIDLLPVALSGLAEALGVSLDSLFHESVELNLLELVALRALLRMHGGVLDRREDDIVLFLTISKFYFGRFKITSWTLGLLHTEGDASLFANLLVELDHILPSIITLTIIIVRLVDEDLTP